MKKLKFLKKKILFKHLLLSLMLALIVVVNSIPFTSAQKDHLSNHKEIAYLTLEQDLHPDYAPTANFQNIAPKDGKLSSQDKLRNAAGFGIYMMQFLAGALIYLAGPAAVLVIAVSGLRYVVSHGEEGEITNAKKSLTYAIVGLIVIILSYAIIKAIISAGMSLV